MVRVHICIIHNILYYSYTTVSKQVQKARERPPTREEEEEEGEKIQVNPAYLPIEMSYKSQESKYINVSTERYVCVLST